MTAARTLLTDQMRRRLVARRKRLGLTQQDVGHRMGGIGRSLVCRMETGSYTPSTVDMWDRWCGALGMKLRVEIE